MLVAVLGRGKISKLVEDILPPTVTPVFYDDTVAELPGIESCVEQDLVVAIETVTERAELFEKFRERRFATLIGANAVVSQRASVGTGSIIGHGVVVHSGARLGRGTFIDASSVIDVDATLEDFCSVGAHVFIGQGSVIGAGSVIGNGARIFAGVTIGAGVHVPDGAQVHRNSLERSAQDVPPQGLLDQRTV